VSAGIALLDAVRDEIDKVVPQTTTPAAAAGRAGAARPRAGRGVREALTSARARPAVPHYAEFSAAFRSVADGYLRRKEQIVGDPVRERLEAALDGRPPDG
jgi:hypothetical protein